MKQKEFTMHASATDKNNVKHEITVVGVFTQIKENYTVNRKMNEFNEICYTNKKLTNRLFRIAYSICNPVDNFDEEYGIKLAKKRIKTHPVYELSSFNFTALNDDMCNMLLLNEIVHISKNIDKYIKNNS